MGMARILNMGLRLCTLFSRFLFVFFLARYMDAEAVGYYGLFTATVGYFLYLVGLDFYTYSTREIIKAPDMARGQMLKGQVSLSALLYLVILPLAAWVVPQAKLPAELLVWFFPILVLEHLNQEICRLLTALSEQVTASLILFLRQGSWALAIVALMALDAELRQLRVVMACWAVAGLAAAWLGIRKLRHLHMGGWQLPVDWAWVRKGVTVSLAFLVATLALRGVQTVDRYWLQSLANIETVGAYVLFLNIASTLMVFLDAGIFAFAYPELIALCHKKQYQLVNRKALRLLAYVVISATAFSIVSWLLLPYLLQWINKPIYGQSLWLYPWLLLAMVINALSMVPHFALYAKGHDKAIIGSHIGAMLVFAIGVWQISQHRPLLAVPAGLVIFFAFILLSKTIAYLASLQASSAEPVVLQQP